MHGLPPSHKPSITIDISGGIYSINNKIKPIILEIKRICCYIILLLNFVVKKPNKGPPITAMTDLITPLILVLVSE